MQRVFHIISLLFLILTSQLSYAGDSRHEWIEKGDVFFQRRAEGHNEDWAAIIFIEQALSAYLKAYDIGEPTPELVEKILWASYFYATYAEKNPKKQKEVLQNAIKIGEEALKRYPNNVAINYQMAGCWGQWGLVNGIFASAREGVAQKIRYHAEKVIMLDSSYEEGSGYRILGRLHFKAPKIPIILSWPNKKEALKYLSQAVEVGPKNLTNHLFYAESLYDAGLYQEALKHVDIILNAQVNPQKVIENLRDKKEAEDLKRKLLKHQ